MKIITLLTLLLALTSCCRSKLIATIKFTGDELAVNPYTGSEKLVFVDNNGNTVTYDNGHRKTNLQEMNECKEGCCDYYMVESSDNTYYESPYLKSNLQVVISNNFDMDSGERDPLISFAWHNYENELHVTGTNFGFFTIDSLKENSIENGIFKDSLKLRNQMFYEVFTFPGNGFYPDKLHADTLFFTKSNGIVGLKFSDGNLWVIQ